MRTVSPPIELSATNVTVQTDSEACDQDDAEASTDRTDSDGGAWFAEMARDLLGEKDTGYQLHKATKLPERSCYRYTAKKPRPAPSNYLRAFLRSDHGFRVLRWIMRDSDAVWWANIQRAIRITAEEDKIDRSRHERTG